MVNLGSMCIDSTEVTNGQYAAFLATNPSTAASAQHPKCAWNSSFDPTGVLLDADPSNPQPLGPEYPVVYVDWCDAYAFCAWSGKRLCGKIGGGQNATTDFANATRSQWYFACIAGSATNILPYGTVFSNNTCNGYYFPSNQLSPPSNNIIPPKAASGCHAANAPYSAVYDLSGNADEWEDSCDATGTGADQNRCRTRGGGWSDKVQGALQCDANYLGYTRSTHGSAVGIRCCSP